MDTTLKVGDRAPEFSLKNDVGQDIYLSSLTGKWLVLYCYPRDDAPGCTVEACSLRDARDKISELGAEIVGISKDSPNMHEKFKARHSINFVLLSDPNADVIKRYGAWSKSIFIFKHVVRKTLIVDPSGIIAKIYEYTTPIGSGERIAADLHDLQRAERAQTASVASL
jgi:peroxiredoxin Q/BCP